VRAVRGIGVVAAALAVLALAACGGGGGHKLLSPEQSKQAVADAAQKTRGAGAHLDLAVTLHRLAGNGAAVYGASGDLDPAGGHLQIDQRGTGGDLRQEVISRSGGRLVLYESPPGAITLPKGKTWLKLDLTRYGRERYGANTTFLAGADQDPYAALELATARAAHVTDLGLQWLPDRTLDTHFRATVDVVAVAKEKGVTGKALKRLAADVNGRRQTIDVWVSKQGRVARVKVQKIVLDAATGGKLRQTSIADFSRFGERVRVTLPPSSLVADYFTLAP
jgi:hypothetical protein